MSYGPAFYTNICKLFSTLNGGIKHQKPTVKMPLSKVGLELSRILTNLGIIDDFTIGQRVSRITSHSPLWEPTRTHIGSTKEAVGYNAMYLTLHLNYDKHKPLWCRTPLAAAPHIPSLHLAAHSSSSRSSGVSSSSISSSSSLVPDPSIFTPPQGLNSPTPERVKLMSKPSVQRCMGVKQLLSTRRNLPPGIFLLSTTQGLLTDIDCELRGLGGVVLAHLALPLGHVVQLRGLLTRKFYSELQSVLPPGLSASELDPATIAQYNAARKVPCAPLAEWDARVASLQGLAERVQRPFVDAEHNPAKLVKDLHDSRAGGREKAEDAAAYGELDLLDEQQLLLAAEQLMGKLELRQVAWEQQGRSSSSGSDSVDGVGDSRGDSSSSSSIGGRSEGGYGGSERRWFDGAYSSSGSSGGGGGGGVDRWSSDGRQGGARGGRGLFNRQRQ